MAKQVVFASTGSLGDLHPFLALGQALEKRGHRVTIATTRLHQATVEHAGLRFSHMRPDADNTPAFHARYMHPRKGGEFVYRQFLAPAVRDSYADLRRATAQADLLVSQSLMALAAPLVAGSQALPWLSCVLQPMAFFSRYDRPSYLPMPWLPDWCARSPELHGRVQHYVRRHTAGWLRPVTALRQELGLAGELHPMHEGQHAPEGVLALFSPLLGQPQPDWPAQTVQTGTPLYEPADELPPALARFLAQDDKPLAVFTLSSAASNDAGRFYRESLQAAGRLGLRALLVTGGLAATAPLPEPLPPWAYRVRYAPFEQVFPAASVIVHAGGVATSFKALQAGKPQLVVPHAHDQLDNGLRLAKLGVAVVLPARGLRARSMAEALRRLLQDGAIQQQASRLATQAQNEDGVSRACDEIERRLVA